MLGNRSWDEWIAQYSRSHEHPVNRFCHTLGIPLIAVSLPLFGVAWFVEGLWVAPLAMFAIGGKGKGEARSELPPVGLQQDRQHRRAEVERLGRELEAENLSLRRDLIANVSHDLRTPLVSMRGYLELLAEKGRTLTPAQRDEYLGIAVRQSEHLARLIDELFELARWAPNKCCHAHDPVAGSEVLQRRKLRPAEGDARRSLRRSRHVRSSAPVSGAPGRT